MAVPSFHPNVDRRPNTERMSDLAETFPSLRGRPGIRPWEATTVMAQLGEPWPGSGARHALQFVLGVWNCSIGRVPVYSVEAEEDGSAGACLLRLRGSEDPDYVEDRDIRRLLPNAEGHGLAIGGRYAFDTMRALASWDDRHRAAFLAWATRPWWA